MSEKLIPTKIELLKMVHRLENKQKVGLMNRNKQQIQNIRTFLKIHNTNFKNVSFNKTFSKHTSQTIIERLKKLNK